MKTINSKLETYQRLISALRWNERNAEQSARIAVSKAVWLGIEKDEVLQLIWSIPAATYVRQYPHVLTQAWETVARACQPSPYASEFEQLLNALN